MPFKAEQNLIFEEIDKKGRWPYAIPLFYCKSGTSPEGIRSDSAGFKIVGLGGAEEG